jgi:hypothetical protein
MTFTEAAAEVLRLAGKPLHYKEITEIAIEKNLLSHVGKSPEVTMGARLAALLKKEDKTNPIVRVKPGVFALREWSDKKGRKAAPQEELTEEAPEVNALEVGALESAAAAEPEVDEDEELEPSAITEDDAMRADLAASAAELFDDEDDDDQPILGGAPSSQAVGGGEPGEGGGRRRRRRRRRRGGGGGSVGIGAEGAPIQPQAVVSIDADSQVDATRDPLAPPPRPLVRDRQQILAGGMPTGIEVPLAEGDELAGKDLADAALLVLSAFDRNGGPVAIRAIVDALVRRGRLGGDPAMAAAQLAASLRATTSAASPRASARASVSRTALAWPPPTGSWVTISLALEQEAIMAVDRYREAARRTMLRRLQELPGHAFVELALLALERAGMTQVRAVKRPGAPGGEAHFSGLHKAGGEEIRAAIVIRKDGREIGRERVSDLRGALHHYGPATSGWLLTTGQVLSGAREEAAVAGAAPVALYDGIALTRLMEDHDVAVVRTHMAIAIPDLEFIESLRS